MSNYYESLHIQPTATDAEITNAIDQQYEQWRRLVTHHDPEVVNQANQQIQLLEKMRGTLTDPAKRAVYDDAIGVRGATAGLVDPNAVLNSPRLVMTPPPPQSPNASPPPPGTGVTTGAVNAWVCPKCAVANGIGTRFCKNCGNALGRECPNCAKTIESVAKFCPECGVDVAKAIISKQIADAEKQRAAEERQRWEATEGKWQRTVQQWAKSKHNTHEAAFQFLVRGSFEDCIGAMLKSLSLNPGKYAFNVTQNMELGMLTALEGGANELCVRVLVERTESVEKRILVCFGRNSYPLDKPIRLILPDIEKGLRQQVVVVQLDRV